MQIRAPAVAGAFYPDNIEKLTESISSCYVHKLGPGNIPPINRKIFGAISPHAGYMYSGPVASHVFHAITPHIPELFIIVGPNHWGIGKEIATAKDCKWDTPLGKVEIDSESAEHISRYNMIDVDFFSHTKEHSIEVQLPMIQHMTKNFKLLPISLIRQDRDVAGMVGLAMAEVAKNKDAIIIGSSDFTHYMPNEIAYKQDMSLIKPILDMDVEKFYNILEENNISACGYGAIASTMIACKRLGATKGELLKYATSGDVTGDMSSVVGYGSIVFT